ncbi:hypothetical protein CMI37_29050 [Candidatus Pacearchaeota archaeon]|nr:hypothetical protein [Candidatus Pacearchaeota archaeon]|tara:strand:+ start:454 stop:897 length:444 start_codon:yes stop_codon:yes gene_type:complete
MNNPDLTIRRRRIICRDGFSMSVQASEFHYCNPRETAAKKYDTVEVGFPSEHEPLLDKYREELPYFNYDEDKWNTVYPYVPSIVIKDIIEAHEGLTKGDLPPMNFGKRLNIPVITGDSDTDELLDDERIAQLEGQIIDNIINMRRAK